MTLNPQAINGWINILFKDYLINSLNNPRRIDTELYIFNRYLNGLINGRCGEIIVPRPLITKKP